MVKRFAVMLGGCAMMAAVGCSGDTASTPGSGSGGDVDATLTRLNNLAVSYCDCIPAGPDRDTCLTSAQSDAITVNDCQRELLATSDGQVLVDCVTGVADDLDACVRDANCDQAAFEACGSAVDSGMGACLQESPIADEMQACDAVQ